MTDTTLNRGTETPGDNRAVPDVQETAPTIADTSYRTYDGPLLPRAAGVSRWGTVARATMRQNVNRKKTGYWIPAVLILILYLFFGIVFYLQRGFQQQLGAANGLTAPTGNPYAQTLYTAQAGISLLLFAAVVTVGSAAIAADNRANALLVYLSKPLGRPDYLLGKWLGVFGLLAALSTLPALLLYLFFLAAYFSEGFLKDNPTLIFKVLAASLFPAALNASLMIGFSAWSKTPRLAGAVYAGFYFVMITASLILGAIVEEQPNASPRTVAILRSLSVPGISDALNQHLYDTTPQQIENQRRASGRRHREERRAARLRREGKPVPVPTPTSETDEPELIPGEMPREPERAPLLIVLLIGAAFIGLPLWAASARIKAVEVVRG